MGASANQRQYAQSTLDSIDWACKDYYRLISFNICIRSNEGEISKKFKSLYTYYHVNIPLYDCIYFSICKNENTNNKSIYTLLEFDKVIFQTGNPVEVLPFLEWFIINALVPKLSPYILLHAAVLSLNGVGIIFPASSGFGKTTLSLALLMHGFKYLTDEVAIINPHSFHILPLPRGLVIREKAFQLLHSLHKPVPSIDFYMRFSQKDFWYFNPSRYVHLPTDAAVPVKYIVFLKKSTLSQKDSLEKIPHAMAISKLLSCSLNSNYLNEETVSNITKLVQNVTCYTLAGHALQGRVNNVLGLVNEA